MVASLESMLERAVPVHEYLAELPEGVRPRFEERRRSYKPKGEVLEEIRRLAEGFTVVVIGASWCKDCVAQVPVLALVSEATGLRVVVLGGVKTDPLNPERRWAVPPSPPEVETLGIERIPTILIYDGEGREVARIIEHPQIKPTLEEELLHHLKAAKTTS